MSTQVLQRSHVGSLFPLYINDESDQLSVTKEIQARVMTTFVFNMLKRGAAAFDKGEYKKLDGNPGDDGCQNTALILERFSHECTDDLKELRSDITSMQMARTKNRAGEFHFFNKVVLKIQLNVKILYIAHCYLSAVMRTPCSVTETGVTLTKSVMGKLGKLSKHMNKLPGSYKNKILEFNQQELSRRSAEILFDISIQMEKRADTQLVCEMLSPSHRRLYTPDETKYLPKTFLCGFYAVKACMRFFEKNSTPIALKSIVKGGGSRYLYVGNGEADSIRGGSLVVFEAVFNTSDEEVEALVEEVGFFRLMEFLAACPNPYQHGSSLEDIANEDARNEIASHREKGAVYQKKLLMDHVYFTSTKEEGL